jgi:hypothetical protein
VFGALYYLTGALMHTTKLWVIFKRQKPSDKPKADESIQRTEQNPSAFSDYLRQKEIDFKLAGGAKDKLWSQRDE